MPRGEQEKLEICYTQLGKQGEHFWRHLHLIGNSALQRFSVHHEGFFLNIGYAQLTRCHRPSHIVLRAIIGNLHIASDAVLQ